MQQRYYEWFRRTYRMQEAMRREPEDLSSPKYRRMMRDLAHIYMVQADVRQVNELATQITSHTEGLWKTAIGWKDALLLAEIGVLNLFMGIEPLWQKRCFMFLEEMVAGVQRCGGLPGQLRVLVKSAQLLSMLCHNDAGTEAEALLKDIKQQCESGFTRIGTLHAPIFRRILEVRFLMIRAHYVEADGIIGEVLKIIEAGNLHTAMPVELTKVYLWKQRMELLEKEQLLCDALQAHKVYTAIADKLSNDRKHAYTAFLQHLYDTKAQEQRIFSLKKETRRLSEQADTDALTGLGNRQALIRKTESFVHERRSEAVAVAAIMADIDYFKAYNDYYGHLQGDVILREIGRIMQDYQEQGWQVFRYGGEEFLLVRKGTSEAVAHGVAENVLAALRMHPIPHGASPENIILMSLGAASRVCSSAEDVRTLIREADDALYRAKKRGRGCCVCFSAKEGAGG